MPFPALRKRVQANGFAQYHNGQEFHPGSGIAVYDPPILNPIESLIGSGTECGSMRLNGFAPLVIPAPASTLHGMHESVGYFRYTPLLESE